jgi:DNA polymerase III epsilon subunit-like protein
MSACEKKEGAPGGAVLVPPVPPVPVRDLIAVDVETGGLYAGTNPLLQIGAFTADGARFEQKILPIDGMVIERAAAKKNGYDPDVWKSEGVPLLEAMRNFRDWCAKVKRESGSRVCLAHNAGFDRGFLDWAQGRVRVALPLPHRWECSMGALATFIRMGFLEWDGGGCSLDSLCKRAGIRRPEPHDALQDAVATLRGYAWMLNEVRRRRAGASTAVEVGA